MAKITLSDIADIRHPSAATTINANNALIETAIENTLSRDGTTPNQLTTDLDMNSNQIINLPKPNADTDVVRLQDLDEFIADVGDKRFATDQEALDGVSTTTMMSPKLTKDAIQQNIDDEGLGTAAYKNIGTSGDAVPVLNTENTWTGQQKFSNSVFSAGGPSSGIPPSSTGMDYSSGNVSGRFYALGPDVSTNANITFTSYNGNATNAKLGLTVRNSGFLQFNQYTAGGLLATDTSSNVLNRTLTGTANEITVTNGNGASGNPTISIPSAVTLTGKTLTGGTYASAALNGSLGATTPSTVAATTVTASGLITANGGQIKFPATASLSSDVNTLDDYEEGTWTPSISFGGASVGATYNGTTTARYVKIGRNVWISGLLYLTAKGSSTGVAGIASLPFTPTSTPAVGTVGFSSGFSGLTGTMSITRAATAGEFTIYQGTATGNTALTDAVFTDTSRIYFNAWYETNS